jgi:hypothetical protein
MTAPATTGDGTPVVLSSEEAAKLRQVLVACSQLLTRPHRSGGPASTLLADITRQLAGGRSPGGLLYDINLAIDYLDFAPAARSRR